MIHVRRTLAGLAVAVAWAVLSAPAAVGGAVMIAGTILTGFGPTEWDPGTNNVCLVSGAYVPVNDGSFKSQDDGFDGGLALEVEGTSYADSDGLGDLDGQQLTTGPETIDGIEVTRIDRALETSPTLRSLVKLENTSGTDEVLSIMWATNLGSNGGTRIRDSSTGDRKLTRADRWVVTGDDPDHPDDPPVTHVFFGPGDVSSDVRDVVLKPPDSTDCIQVELRASVPEGKTRYLLFFAEMNPTNRKASKGAAKFNDVSAGDDLLDGLGQRVRRRILNWDVA